MPTKPTCRPWCDEHDEQMDDSCTRVVSLISKGEAGPIGQQTQSPELAALAMQFQDGGLVEKVDTILLDVTQGPDEDEPEMVLRICNSSKDDDSAQLFVDISDLKDLQASLGQAIQVFE